MTILSNESHQLLSGVINLIYFMRGAISYTEAWNMSYVERDTITSFLKERIDQESGKMTPIY